MNNFALFAGLGGAVVAGAVVIALSTGMLDRRDPPQVQATLPPQPVPASPTEPAAQAAAPVAETPAPTAKTGQPAPGFDIVRVDATGQTLVAGYGAAGARVSILVDGGTAAQTEIGTDGKFVSLLDLHPVTEPRVFRLRQTSGVSVVDCEQDVILAPEPVEMAALPPPVPQEAAEAFDEPVATGPAQVPDAIAAVPAPAAAPEPETAMQEAPVLVVETPEPPQEVAAAAAADRPVASQQPSPMPTAVEPQPDAPAVFLRGRDGVEVLADAPLPPGDVALDAINYDSGGEVLLSGRGDGDAFVRVYLDNTPVSTARIREDGRWRLTLPEVDTGTYTLRVDQLDTAGAVTARVESPFLRESPEMLAAAAAQDPDATIKAITVQPGNTLWAIARDRYGDGLDYVRVFEANRDRIRDPDLIYPGQIFDLPDE